MAIQLNGSDQWVGYYDAAVFNFPMTIAGWFRTTSASAQQHCAAICRFASTNMHLWLGFRGDIGGDPVAFSIRDNTPLVIYAETTTGYSINTWHHLAGVWAAADDIRVYIDGGSKGIATTPTLLTGLVTANRTCYGVSDGAGTAYYLQGRVAEPCV